MKETNIQNKIRLAISKLPSLEAVTFRNNTGEYRTPEGHIVRYGLCRGSSDLIGWRSIIVTDDMVGMRLAVFLALEIKRSQKARRSQEQINFIDQIRAAGGIAEFVSSELEAIEAIKARP